MRLYHFTTAYHGLDDIDRRRLKIATIPDLNDPFELLCVDLSNEKLRASMYRWKKSIGKRWGMLCFSANWENSVQWSHYAEKHAGLCLGFDVADETAMPVTYDEQRSAGEAKKLLTTSKGDEALMKKFLSTKYHHWAYEQEYRVYVDLVDIDPVTKLFFCDFGDALKLAEVIIGSESDVERAQVSAVLRELHSTVTVTNARLAFKTFRVVT